MGGVACNGWRFWSLAGGESEQAAAEARPSDVAVGSKPAGPGKRTCEACGKAFMSDQQLAHHQANAERLCQPVA